MINFPLELSSVPAAVVFDRNSIQFISHEAILLAEVEDEEKSHLPANFS